MKAVARIGRLDATVVAPPSKSVTNRALLLAAMTDGPTTITNALDSDDSRYMLEAIRKIGYDVTGSFKEGLTIGSRVSISANDVRLFVGNAGTAMRFLAGFLNFTPGRFILEGEKRMHERPIGDLVEALRSIGGEIEYLGEQGYPPIQIRGKRMRGGFEVAVSGDTSSQFVSSLMMAGATLPDGMRLRSLSTSSRPYIDLTRSMLEDFGASVNEKESGVFMIRSQGLRRDVFEVEGDYSSASYWFAAAAATGGSIAVSGLRNGSVQGDRRFLEVLTAMGCSHEWNQDRMVVKGAPQLHGGEFDCNDIPDIVPTLAAIAPLADSPVVIRNVANLRVKESDRLAALASELRKLGAAVEEQPDGLTIQPGWSHDPAVIDPHDDHRLAMSFAIAGLARGGITIAEEQVVGKSYPSFWRVLDGMTSTV